MSGDVAGFIEARLSEWQATAEAARDVERVQWQDDDLSDQPVEWLRHYASHSPARVLRQVAALRAILDLHTGTLQDTRIAPEPFLWCPACRVSPPCPTVRDLAVIWWDHPEYEHVIGDTAHG